MVTSLTPVEFDLVWESLGFAERPYPIEVPSFGETLDERDRLRAGVFDALAARGLHDGHDLDRRFEDQLVLLARNEFSVDGLLSVGRSVRLLGAGRGGHAVLAVQTGDRIRIGPVGGGGVVAEIAGLIPDVDAGPGNPVALPKAVFDDAVDAYVEAGFGGLEAALNRGGVSGRDMRTIATLVESPRRGGGQVAANRLDRVGRRSRTDVVNWFDTTAGRYLGLPERGGQWLRLVPADSGRLLKRLTDLVASVS